MNAFVFSRWHHDLDHIAGLKTVDALGLFGLPAWEPVFVRIDHLPTTPPHGLDQQRLLFGAKLDSLPGLAYASGVNPVRFGVSLLYPVEFSTPTRPNFDGQAGCIEHSPDSPTDGIDRANIFQRFLGLHLNVGEPKLGGGLIALALIAVTASQAQVRDSIATAPALGGDMLDFKRGVGLPAVTALAAVLL